MLSTRGSHIEGVACRYALPEPVTVDCLLHSNTAATLHICSTCGRRCYRPAAVAMLYFALLICSLGGLRGLGSRLPLVAPQRESSPSSRSRNSSWHITRTQILDRAYLICKSTVVLVHGVCHSAVSVEQETANVHNKDQAPPEGRCRRPVVPWPHLHTHPKLHVNGDWLPPVFFLSKRCCRVCFGGVSTLTCAPGQAGQGTDLLKTNKVPFVYATKRRLCDNSWSWLSGGDA